jgi:hypothetical protein
MGMMSNLKWYDRRDHHVFNKNNIQRFIRECAQRDISYVGGPWIIDPRVATNYSIDTTLPSDLRLDDSVIVAQHQSQQKFKKNTGKTADEREAERKAKKEQFLLQKIKLKEERERQREEKKRQAAVKYPLEDLDLPIYRKNPNTNWALVDMCPLTFQNNADTVIPYPSGGRSERPVPHHDLSIPPELFDTFLSVYAFVNVFAEPLKIPSFSIDEFERALLHNTHQPKATVLVEYNSCLLNVIINERKKDTANELANGDVMESYVDEMEGSDDENEQDDESEKKLPRVERGWRDEYLLKLSQKWDNKELRQSYDRRGWETTLIGCLNDVATPDLISDLDEILQHLVPRYQSTAADREQQYPTLSLKYKLEILSFLVDVVNESTLIK